MVWLQTSGRHTRARQAATTAFHSPVLVSGSEEATGFWPAATAIASHTAVPVAVVAAERRAKRGPLCQEEKCATTITTSATRHCKMKEREKNYCKEGEHEERDEEPLYWKVSSTTARSASGSHMDPECGLSPRWRWTFEIGSMSFIRTRWSLRYAMNRGKRHRAWERTGDLVVPTSELMLLRRQPLTSVVQYPGRDGQRLLRGFSFCLKGVPLVFYFSQLRYRSQLFLYLSQGSRNGPQWRQSFDATQCLQGEKCGLPWRRVVRVSVIHTLEKACFLRGFGLDGRKPEWPEEDTVSI